MLTILLALATQVTQPVLRPDAVRPDVYPWLSKVPENRKIVTLCERRARIRNSRQRAVLADKILEIRTRYMGDLSNKAYRCIYHLRNGYME